MSRWQRAVIFIAIISLIPFLFAAFGYFILVTVIENQASRLIEKEVGFPAKVEIYVPFNFIFTGKVEKARISLPLVQLNGLNIRQIEITSKPFQIPVFKAAFGDYSFIKKVKASGTFVITPKDLNDYLRSKGENIEVEIDDNNLYVTTYVSGVGKIKVAGRLEGYSNGASFVAERLIEPKMVTLILYPQLWVNISFNFSLSPAERVFVFDRFFIDEKFIKVFFKLKEGFYEEVI